MYSLRPVLKSVVGIDSRAKVFEMLFKFCTPEDLDESGIDANVYVAADEGNRCEFVSVEADG